LELVACQTKELEQALPACPTKDQERRAMLEGFQHDYERPGAESEARGRLARSC
jgi:hypothetical protein